MLTKLFINNNRKPLPKILWIQLDNCWRENKNQILLAFLADLVWRKVFDDVQISFLIKGHTHFSPDQMFSRISVRLTKTDVYCSEAFLHELSESRTPSLSVETIDVCASIKQYLKENKIIRDVEGQSAAQCFKIIRCTKYGDPRLTFLCVSFV